MREFSALFGSYRTKKAGLDWMAQQMKESTDVENDQNSRFELMGKKNKNIFHTFKIKLFKNLYFINYLIICINNLIIKISKLKVMQ